MSSGKSGRKVVFNPEASARSDVYLYEEGPPGAQAIKKEELNQRLYNVHLAKVAKQARNKGVRSMGGDKWTDEDEKDYAPFEHPFLPRLKQTATVNGKYPNKSPRNLQPGWEFQAVEQEGFEEKFPRSDRDPSLTTTRRDANGQPVMLTTAAHGPHPLSTDGDWTTQRSEVDEITDEKNPFYSDQSYIFDDPYTLTPEEFEQNLPNYVGDDFSNQGNEQSTSTFAGANQSFPQYSSNSEYEVPCYGSECPNFQKDGECTTIGCPYIHGSVQGFDEDYFNDENSYAKGSHDAGVVQYSQQPQQEYYQQQHYQPQQEYYQQQQHYQPQQEYYQQQQHYQPQQEYYQQHHYQPQQHQPDNSLPEFDFSFGGRKGKSKSNTKRRNKKSKETKRNYKK